MFHSLQVSVGTLLSFTVVAISVLIIRYVPPDEVPLPSSLPASITEVGRIDDTSLDEHIGTSKDVVQPLLHYGMHPLMLKQSAECSTSSYDEKRRKIAGWTIMLTCIGALLLSIEASDVTFPSIPRFTICVLGASILISSLVVLSCINQDDGRHSFGHTGGFLCPLVPLLPVASILINVYLLVNLGTDTWVRVLIWLVIGVLIYAFYGRSHSSLRDAVYVPAALAEELHSRLSSCN